MDFDTSDKYYIVTELARFDLLEYLRLKGIVEKMANKNLLPTFFESSTFFHAKIVL